MSAFFRSFLASLCEVQASALLKILASFLTGSFIRTERSEWPHQQGSSQYVDDANVDGLLGEPNRRDNATDYGSVVLGKPLGNQLCDTYGEHFRGLLE